MRWRKVISLEYFWVQSEPEFFRILPLLDMNVYTQDNTQWRLGAESNTCPNVANSYTIERERSLHCKRPFALKKKLTIFRKGIIMFATQFSVVEQFFATFQQSRQFLNKVSLTRSLLGC
jgi:hypothetical protein